MKLCSVSVIEIDATFVFLSLACSPLLHHLLKTPSSPQTIAQIPNISVLDNLFSTRTTLSIPTQPPPPPLFLVAPYSLSLPLSSPPYSHPSLIIIHNPQTLTLTAIMITALCTLHLRKTISKPKESFKRIVYHVRQTGVAASILWQSLRSVLSSANHEVRVGFELRVVFFLADIAAANAARRAALVGAGGGAVVDWLLETVAVSGNGCGTQAEVAWALAYLIADPNVSADVLGRPRAVPYLPRFLFSCQPKKNVRFLLPVKFGVGD